MGRAYRFSEKFNSNSFCDVDRKIMLRVQNGVFCRRMAREVAWLLT